MFRHNKYTLLAICTTAALCSACSSDDTIDVSQSSAELKFKVGEVSSRATMTDGTTITQKPFTVYGDMLKNDAPAGEEPTVIFDATRVTYAGGIWSYGTPLFWTPENTYSFVALHTAEDPNIKDLAYENSNLSFTYSAPQNYKNNSDLLISTHHRNYISAGNPHAIALSFHHIMARLNFVAKIDPALGEGNTVTITRLVLRNVFDKATYSITPAPIASGTSETDDFVGLWLSMENSGSGEEFPTSTLFDITLEQPLTLTVGDTHEFFPAISDPLLVIPQNLDPEHSLEFELDYYVTLNGTPQAPKTPTAKLYSASAVHGRRWLAGLSYSYSFTLGGEGRILFNVPQVQEWDSTEGGNYVITDPKED